MDNQTSENHSNKQSETRIGRDVSDGIIVNGNGNVINVGEKQAPKRTRRKAKTKKAEWSNPVIFVAVIGAIATIVAALLSSPLLEKWANPTPTATPTISTTPTESATATEYLTATPIIVVVTGTEVPVTPPTATFTPTLENTATASPSPEPKVDKMTAILQSTVDEGKAPLNVNFDARTSYAQFAEGSIVPCRNNPFCSYVFAIYRDSKFVERRSNNTGLLSYTCGTKGKYFVTVYVCRGGACNDDGITVNVK